VFWRTVAKSAHPTSQNRDAPNFLYAVLERTACAPFIKERRMKFREPKKFHRKSGVWATHRFVAGIELKRYFVAGIELKRYFVARMELKKKRLLR
jgi:hypothetical protein